MQTTSQQAGNNLQDVAQQVGKAAGQGLRNAVTFPTVLVQDGQS